MADPDALLALLNALDDRGYDFVTPTPATHLRVVRGRPAARPGELRDVFGWSLPFEHIDAQVLAIMEDAGVLEESDGVRRSAVRVSRLHGRLFLHSAFPTEAEDSVFFGPDSYRFADFILANLDRPAERIIDIGAGAGVGGIVAAAAQALAALTLTDVNPKALTLAKINAAHAGLSPALAEGEGLAGVAGSADLILANPPFMVDADERAYRDGGGLLGAELSIAWAREALERLEPGGRLLLYSGSAIVEGHDGLRTALEALPEVSVSYREIDPDIFGEELVKPAYAGVERIAAVGAVLTRL